MLKPPETYFIRTYGCQMNELDTEVMRGILERRGLKQAETEEEAELKLYNTCSIRDLAERKAMGRIGKITHRKKRGFIGVTGCMANAKKESLFQKLPGIDFVIGTNNIHQLNFVLDEVLSGQKKVLHADGTFRFELDYEEAKREDNVKAYVSIIRGCNKFCTYCVVPYTRGPEVSRDPDSIVSEVKKLVDKGYKEITLLGQNVNSYGKDFKEGATLFPDLLYRLDQETGIRRIRFMTSHPCDITKDLMEATRDLSSLCEFIHFPMQAGSNRILRKMHRIYTIEEYLEKVALYREICPNVSLGTDIIVGFPTETEEEFQETYDRMEELMFSQAFLFAYSQRKGTPATRFKDDVPETVKEERLQRLMSLQDAIYQKQRQEMLGTIVEVLVDKESPKTEGQMRGRTRCWKKVVFDGDRSMIGTFQNVKVDSYTHQTLLGTRLP